MRLSVSHEIPIKAGLSSLGCASTEVRQGVMCPKFVELVGPAGSGKSTLVDEIRMQHGEGFDYIGRPQIAFPWRVAVRLQAYIQLKTMKGASRLSRREKSRLLKGMASVIQGQQWIARQKQGLYILDEGPIRVMMDYACHSKQQLALWKAFCHRILPLLSDKRILVVHVIADQELRFRRRQHRMSRLEMEDPRFNPKYKECSRLVDGKPRKPLLFNRNDLINIISSGNAGKISESTIRNDSELSGVAKDLAKKIRFFSDNFDRQ